MRMKLTTWLFDASQFILLFSLSIAAKSHPSSLYSDGDPLWELDATNFNGVVFGKDTAWIIEFYNNWCGHCIRFAPTWKQFSRQIRTWKNVIEVAVVNCNDAQNINLCRYYEVESFPTIKLFWHHTTANDTGEMLEGNRDIASMENGVIDFLEANWNKGVPYIWPKLHPLEKSYKAEMFERHTLRVFVEFPTSYIGRKIILDLSLRATFPVRRILTSDDSIMKSLQIEVSNDTIPVLLELTPEKPPKVLRGFPRLLNETIIRNRVYRDFFGSDRVTVEPDDNAHPDGKSNISSLISDAVYRIDLENALYNSLNKEIAVSKLIEGDKLVALKSYLSVLKNFFPGTKSTMRYLTKLWDWASSKTSISGEEFVEALQAIKTRKEHIRAMRSYVGCKGSEPKYRGYPCSLWTLFHILTVQANKKSDNIKEGPKGKEVLFVIRDYIKYFFTCEECVKNFLKMAVDMEDEVEDSRDAVLWLWKAHNEANNRLAGDVTEDPKHPKIQFPPVKICSKCRRGFTLTEIVWDKARVLLFLRNFFDEQNIVSLDDHDDDDYLTVDQSEQGSNSAMDLKLILSPTSALLPLLLSFYRQTLETF